MQINTNQTYLIALTNFSNDTQKFLDTFLGVEDKIPVVQLYTAQKTQFWQLELAEHGAYTIVNQANGLVLDGDAQGTVHANTKNPVGSNSASYQEWFFELLSGGFYSIRNRATGLYLRGAPESGDVCGYSGNPSQNPYEQWSLLTSFTQELSANTPCFLARKNTLTKVLTQQDKNYLNLKQFDGTNDQFWDFEPAEMGFYTIVNASTGLVLDGDLQGNVHANTPNPLGSDAAEYQQWFFYDVKTDYYIIRNRATQLILAADDTGNVSGQNINTISDQQNWQYSSSFVSLDMGELGRLYPQGWNATIDGGNRCAEYTSADSQYRSKQPIWTPGFAGGGTAVMQIDHVRGSAAKKDDHATLTATFLSNGQLYSSSLSWTLGGQWAIEWAEKVIVKIEDEINQLASDEAGEAAVAIADVLTEGALAPFDPVINKIASDMTSKLIESLFSNLNGMLKNEIGHDDGGRQTFIAVINHNLNKLCSSMNVTPPYVLPDIGIRFDIDGFPGHLYNNLYALYGKDILESSVTWSGNQTSDYIVQGGKGDGNHKFRTWKLDSSAYPMKEGLYVSTKIDLKHGSAAKDGHYVVMLGVGNDGKVLAAQAVLEFPPDQHLESYLSPVFIGTHAIDQLYQDLCANKAFFAAPQVVKVNLDSMLQSIILTK